MKRKFKLKDNKIIYARQEDDIGWIGINSDRE